MPTASDDHAVTANGAANFAPFFLPGGKDHLFLQIIFSSNMADPKGRDFDLYTIRDDGTGLTRSRSAPTSTASRCSRATASGSSSPPTATATAARNEHLRGGLDRELARRRFGRGRLVLLDEPPIQSSLRRTAGARASATRTGPRKSPLNPNVARPPSTPKKTVSVPIRAFPETRNGRRMLSAEPTTTTPQATMKIVFQATPWASR